MGLGEGCLGQQQVQTTAPKMQVRCKGLQGSARLRTSGWLEQGIGQCTAFKTLSPSVFSRLAVHAPTRARTHTCLFKICNLLSLSMWGRQRVAVTSRVTLSVRSCHPQALLFVSRLISHVRVTFGHSVFFFSLSYIHMLHTVTHTRVTFNYHHSGLAYIGAVTREKIVRPTTLARVKKRD